jgi:hypothetical protein
LGAVDFNIQKTSCFAGRKTVGSWRMAREPFAQELEELLWPGWRVIAAGYTGHPLVLLTPSAGSQIIGIKLVKAAPAKIQLLAGVQGV